MSRQEHLVERGCRVQASTIDWQYQGNVTREVNEVVRIKGMDLSIQLLGMCCHKAKNVHVLSTACRCFKYSLPWNKVYSTLKSLT